jgi:nicotinamidase-related amidase
VALIDRFDSILVVIDAQPGFYAVDALSEDELGRAREAVDRARWLARVAAALDVPIVITEEDSERNGATDPAILEHLPPSTPVFPKPVFGLSACDDIMDAINASGRRTGVLTGFETDVCVAHSAIGLRELGFRVVVVEDATFSPGDMHLRGLQRIAAAGVERNHAKGVFYEWLRTLNETERFLEAAPELSHPPGFRL